MNNPSSLSRKDVAPAIFETITESLVSFWNRSVDRQNGGVFNCWSNDGTRLVSRDKYTWSQGRFLWIWSRLAATMAKGLLPGNPADYLAQAEVTAEFIEKHAFLE